MHTREVKKINGIYTIVSSHQTGTDILFWNGEKWVVDMTYTININQMLRSALKKDKE